MNRILPALLWLVMLGTASAGERALVTDALPPWPKNHVASLDADVHLAAVAMSDDDAPVTVRLAKAPRPVVLVVVSREPVEWRLVGELGQLKAVIVADDRHRPHCLLRGLPAGVPAFRVEMSGSDRYRGWSRMAPLSRGGQRLDPAARIDPELVGRVAGEVIGFHGFASYSIAWRSRELQVPGGSHAEPSVRELRDVLAAMAAQPGGEAYAPLRDRLSALGDPPPLNLGSLPDPEIHLVDLAPCRGSKDCGRKQRIVVPPSGHPIVLALRSKRDAIWEVDGEPGARLAGVIIAGPAVPVGLTLPADVPVALQLEQFSPDGRRAAELPDGNWIRRREEGRRYEHYNATGQPLTLR